MKFETKNLNHKSHNDVQYEKLLNFKNFQKNEKFCKRDILLNRRKKNIMHD